MRNDTLQLSPRFITVYQVNSYSKIVAQDIELHATIQRRAGRGSGTPFPLNHKQYRVSKQYWSGSTEKSQTKPAFNIRPSLARLRNVI